jgi:magnesium transporter
VAYPGFGNESGFVVSTVIIAAIAVALFVIFKNKKWL